MKPVELELVMSSSNSSKPGNEMLVFDSFLMVKIEFQMMMRWMVHLDVRSHR